MEADRMKGYLAVTGTLFGLLALVHVWKALSEWPRAMTEPAETVETVIGAVAAALCIWAWRLLLRRPSM